MENRTSNQLQVREYTDWDSLPQSATSLLNDTYRPVPWLSVDWFKLLFDSGMDDARSLRLFTLHQGNGSESQIVALLVGRTPACPNGSIMRRRPISSNSISGLTGFQTHGFGLIISPCLDSATAWGEFISYLSSLQPSPCTLDFACLGTDPEKLNDIIDAFRRTRFKCYSYPIFTRRHQNTTGQSFHDYVASRPPKPRSLIKKQYLRKERKIDRDFRSEFRVFIKPAETGDAVAAYHRVAEASWKPAERFPHFMSSLISLGLASGFLHLYALFLDDHPVSTAVVFLDDRNATIFRNDYDPEYSTYSIGAVLLCKMMRHLLDEQGIDRLDCGRDDEYYKKIWASELETVYGIVAYDTSTTIGLRGCIRHQYELFTSGVKTGLLRLIGRPRMTS